MPSGLKIYLSYPYRDDPIRRVEEVKDLARKLTREKPSRIFLIPHLAFVGFEEEFGREYALKCSKELLSCADVLCLGIRKGEKLSEGMQEELQYAIERGIDHVFIEDLAQYEERHPSLLRGDPPIDHRVFQFMLAEYREAGEFYRHNYATIWQSGSILIASAFVVAGFLIQSGGIGTLLTLVPIVLIAFWWLGIFEPMNRYGDWRLKWGSEIESRLENSPEFQGSGSYQPMLFRGFGKARFRISRIPGEWRPWPYRVRWAVRFGISLIETALILPMIGMATSDPAVALLAVVALFGAFLFAATVVLIWNFLDWST